jgi:hypothetical protein
MPGILYDLQGFRLARRIVTTAFSHPRSCGCRGNVRAFSASSGARMRRYLRCCVSEYRVLGTLTYPFHYPCDGRTVKRHLDLFAKRYAYRVRISEYDVPIVQRKPFSMFWFLEFQRRGAPHFHFFATHEIPRLELSRMWYEIVGSDDSRHLIAGTRIEAIRSGKHGMVSYALKYAAKADQKEIPANYVNCGRFWGIYGSRAHHAATLLFCTKTTKKSLHESFLNELRPILQNAGTKIRAKRYGSYTVIAYLNDASTINAVTALFSRYGTTAIADDVGILFESPLLDCPIEDIES